MEAKLAGQGGKRPHPTPTTLATLGILFGLLCRSLSVLQSRTVRIKPPGNYRLSLELARLRAKLSPGRNNNAGEGNGTRLRFNICPQNARSLAPSKR